jgi:hypothetical protein
MMAVHKISCFFYLCVFVSFRVLLFYGPEVVFSFSLRDLFIYSFIYLFIYLNIFIYNFRDMEWDFLPFRVWVGFWTGLFILIIVALDLSALVRYITRFTEESFACLIALIFIYEAFKKTYEIESEAPVQFSPRSNDVDCLCIIYNSSNSNQLAESLKHAGTGLTSMNVSTSLNSSTGLESAAESQCSKLGGTITGETCQDNYVPDVFFFSVILFLGTYFLATILVNFRHSLFFPTFVSTVVNVSPSFFPNILSSLFNVRIYIELQRFLLL